MKSVNPSTCQLVKPSKLKDIVFVIFSGILLIFSFPPFSAGGGSALGGNFWIFAWFALVPLFFSLIDKSFVKSFSLSYLLGLIFFATILFWITHVTYLGYVLLVLYLSIYFGLFGIFFKILQKKSKIFILGLSSAWVILEYLRAHVGNISFNWAGLSHSQVFNLRFIQIADLGGAYLVSFVLILINIFIWKIFLPLSGEISPLAKKNKKQTILSLIGLVILIYAYGIFRLKESRKDNFIKVSIIQPNIAQELKIKENENFILDKTIRLSELAKKENPDLIIWPEASFPGYWGQDLTLQEKVLEYCVNSKVNLLLGTARIEKKEEEQFFNSAVLVFPNRSSQIYNKIKLVPFGEYVPLRKFFGFLETIVFVGDFTKGEDYKIFKIPLKEATFSVLICFEDTFSDLARVFVLKGAHFLVNITNDAWFKKTPAPHQHLQASIFRAIENRRFIVRSANTGISCFINDKGRVFSYVQDKKDNKIFISGFKTENILLNDKISFYAKFGDWFVLLALIFLIYAIIKINLTKDEPR